MSVRRFCVSAILFGAVTTGLVFFQNCAPSGMQALDASSTGNAPVNPAELFASAESLTSETMDLSSDATVAMLSEATQRLQRLLQQLLGMTFTDLPPEEQERRIELIGDLTAAVEHVQSQLALLQAAVAKASCEFNGVKVASGLGVPAYRSASVSHEEQCVSETRVCDDGHLSGSFEFDKCVVRPPRDCAGSYFMTYFYPTGGQLVEIGAFQRFDFTVSSVAADGSFRARFLETIDVSGTCRNGQIRMVSLWPKKERIEWRGVYFENGAMSLRAYNQVNGQPMFSPAYYTTVDPRGPAL